MLSKRQSSGLERGIKVAKKEWNSNGIFIDIEGAFDCQKSDDQHAR